MDYTNQYAVFSFNSTECGKDQSNGNSLTLLVGNLSPEENYEFISLLTSKLSQKLLLKDEGHVFQRMSAQTDGEISLKKTSCFCFLTSVKSSSSLLPNSSKGQGDSVTEEVHTCDIILCLIAHQKVFDVFSQEINAFCCNIIQTFNWDICELQCLLNCWLEESGGYLKRTVSTFGVHIAHLFEMALYGFEPVILRESKDCPVREEDIMKTMELISIRKLIPTKNLIKLKSLPQPTFILQNSDVQIKNCPSLHETSVNWCDKVLLGLKSNNPLVVMKEIFNLYHIKIIQALNSLKRYIREAEENYYALYKTYRFLKSSKVPSILLNHVKNEDGVSINNSSMKVIKVLECMFEDDPIYNM